jgi:hypothetical protein
MEMRIMGDFDKSGVELIADERRRQIEEEKYSLEHDRSVNKCGQLSWAAIAYAAPGRVYRRMGLGESNFKFVDPFPWDIQYDVRLRTRKADRGSFCPSEYEKEERMSLLIKAGALIAAEIDRLNKWQK